MREARVRCLLFQVVVVLHVAQCEFALELDAGVPGTHQLLMLNDVAHDDEEVGPHENFGKPQAGVSYGSCICIHHAPFYTKPTSLATTPLAPLPLSKHPVLCKSHIDPSIVRFAPSCTRMHAWFVIICNFP